MSLNRTKSWLFAWGLQLLLLSTAVAQGVPPFATGEVGDVSVFAQPDLTAYDGQFGDALRAPSGYYGGVDALFWFVSAPRRRQVGLENGSRQVYINNSAPIFDPATGNYTTNNTGLPFAQETNGMDTGFLQAAVHTGMRFDFGYVGDDDLGYAFSGFYVNSASQSRVGQDVSMVFNEPFVTVYNGFQGPGLNGVAMELPILYGYLDQTGGGTTGLSPDGIPDDVNRNNLYGPQGRDRGVVTGNVLTPGTTLSGVPAREGQADTITNLGATGPFPGLPAPLPGTTTPAPKQPIDYGDAVPLPLIFSKLTVVDRTNAFGVEANRLYRVGTGRYGGVWDVFGGARFFDFQDQFTVVGVGGILSDSFWDTKADNRIVAPQVGVRWRRQVDRWVYSAELRLAPGLNFQTIRQQGEIGSNLTQILLNPLPTQATVVLNPSFPTGTVTPPTNGQAVFQTNQPNNPGQGVAAVRVNQPLNMMPTGFSTSSNRMTFSPIGELRANLNYQMFSQVSLAVGWTGTWIEGIARPSNMINYSLPSMGISAGGNKQYVLINGLNIGITINH